MMGFFVGTYRIEPDVLSIHVTVVTLVIIMNNKFDIKPYYHIKLDIRQSGLLN